MSGSPVTATVDFEKDGVQHGFLKLPHSRDESAWGSLMIPLTVAKKGNGPTALLTGGNHGDEYEGPLALFDLARKIDPETLQGRVIIVPAMNYPAFRAAKRTSPIDGGNMNRVFPGRPDGTLTEKIADYFQRVLLPLSDYVLDMHSGGKTLEFLPFAAAHMLEDEAQQSRCVAAMRAFNAPWSLMLMEIDAGGMYDTAAESLGKVFVTTELAGGGTTTRETAEVAKRGVANFLKHAGIMAGDLEIRETRLLDMPDERCYLFSESPGLIEYVASLGDTVEEGDVLARVYDIEQTGRTPREYRARIGGTFTGRHFPGLIATGDFLAVIAVPSN